MEYDTVVVGALETNCILVYCPKSFECAIVDPGAEAHKIFQLISKKDLKPIILLNTHGHVDHTAGLMNVLKKLSRKDIPVVFHQSAFVKRWAIFPNGSRVRLPELDK